MQKDESMEEDDNSFSTFFAETGTGVHTPRAVFVDLEPTVIKNQQLYWNLSRQILFCRSLTRLGQEHTADYSTLATWSLGRWTLDCHLDSNMMIVKEDAANNYARGHYTIGKEQIHTTLEKVDLEVIRLEISWRSDSEDGWEVFWTTGLSCLPLIWRCGVHAVDFLNFWKVQNLLKVELALGSPPFWWSSFRWKILINKMRISSPQVDFPKKAKLAFSIYPAPEIATAIVEPYNAVLYTHTTLEHCDCAFLVDNQVLSRCIQSDSD